MLLYELILQLAARPGGVSTNEVAVKHPYTRQQAGRSCVALVSKGVLFSLRLGHRSALYFASKEARDAYLSLPKTTAPKMMGKKDKSKGRAQWAPDAVAVIPKGLKVQYGPSHPPRFTEMTFKFVHGRGKGTT